MAEPYQYCTRCGDELRPPESSFAKKSDAPPFCFACFNDVLQQATSALVKPVEELAQQLNESLQPFAELVGAQTESSMGDSDG